MNKKPTLKELLNKHNNGINNNNNNNDINKIDSKFETINKKIDNKNYEIIVNNLQKPIKLSFKNAQKLFKKLPKNLRFLLINGREINNLMELYHELNNMDETTFNYHVNEHKNDFKKWINDVLNEKEIAKELENATNLDLFKKKLELQINKIENTNQSNFIDANYSFLKRNYNLNQNEKNNKIDINQTNTKYFDKINTDNNNNNFSSKNTNEQTITLDLITYLDKILSNNNSTNNDFFFKLIKSINMLKEEIEILNEKIDLINRENKTNLHELIEAINRDYDLIENELKHIEKIDGELNKKTTKIYNLEKEIENKEKKILNFYNKIK
ncbi:MAG: hypothetical protein ACOC3X_01980 [Nanoarchaeota archaeon]